MAFRSSHCRFDPKPHSVSYSGPSPHTPAYLPSFTSTALPHPIGQAWQKVCLVKIVSAIALPEVLTVPSYQLPPRKFMIALSPNLWVVGWPPAVPTRCSASAGPCAMMVWLLSLTVAWKPFASTYCGLSLPRATIALRFFDPISAPMPPRAAMRVCEWPPVATPAILTSRSPAMPITAGRAFSSVSLSNWSWTSNVSLPNRCVASRTSIVFVSPLMYRYEGRGALPVITMPSYPAKRSSAPKCPPRLASFQMPVSGDRPHHDDRQPVGAHVPDSRPLKAYSVARGSSGSIDGSISS